MYKQLLLGALALAVVAMMCLPVNAQPAGGTGSASAGKAASEPVTVIDSVPLQLALFERVMIAIGLLLLILILAQLVFLRSSIEKMTGERSLSNPTGTPIR